MKSDSTVPVPTPVPNLPVMATVHFYSTGCAVALDNRIGPSSGADLSLTVCCRPGRYMRSDISIVSLGLRQRVVDSFDYTKQFNYLRFDSTPVGVFFAK